MNALHETKSMNFTAVKTTDIVPQISNEFVVLFCRDFKSNSGMLKMADLIEKTEILCEWLFLNNYSQYQLVNRKKANNASV